MVCIKRSCKWLPNQAQTPSPLKYAVLIIFILPVKLLSCHGNCSVLANNESKIYILQIQNRHLVRINTNFLLVYFALYNILVLYGNLVGNHCNLMWALCYYNDVLHHIFELIPMEVHDWKNCTKSLKNRFEVWYGDVRSRREIGRCCKETDSDDGNASWTYMIRSELSELFGVGYGDVSS